MQPLFLFFNKWLFATSKQRKHLKGFTLLELLISLVIASIVVSGLLYVVIELTKMDKREANLDQVQRDMNRAMEYIADDLQEAVYVYTDPQKMATQLTTDPDFPDSTDEVPILAFWRIDPLEDNLPTCNSTTMTASVLEQCRVLSIRQAAYTLVVYVQKLNSASSNWSGQSRIIRYELSKYTNPILTNLAAKPGYRDPTQLGDPKALFKDWEKGDGAFTSSAGGDANVLVDYVQAPTFTSPVALNRAPLSDAGGACRGYGTDINGDPLYSIVPSTATTTNNNTFFACVRSPGINGVLERQGNQDVYVFLRGNVQGVSGGVRGYSDETSLPILETQVVVKGVVNKSFSQ